MERSGAVVMDDPRTGSEDSPEVTEDDEIVPADSTSAVRGGSTRDEGSEQTLITKEQKSGIRILVVDDEESLCESCGSILEQDGYDVTLATRGKEGLELVQRGIHDIYLIDLFMSGVPGFELMEKALEARPDALVIVITGKPSVESSAETLRRGAWDYLCKPFSATQLLVLVGRAAHTVIVGRETKALQTQLEDRHGTAGDDSPLILGRSPAIRKVLATARKVAATDASVFLSGESGTGKELFAQYIHQNSRRSSRDLVAVNCAALPEPLLESEMFGHMEGAFTGAVRDKAGLVEIANGGTLFLDEITEMAPGTQAKLLRVIQDGIVRRVGSTKTNAVVAVRYLAATNLEPQQALDEGRIRRDLYYRLRVVPLRLPPLRERVEDVPVLARHFLLKFWRRHHPNGEPCPSLSEDAFRELQERFWPGNVRELQNVMEHAVVLAEPGEELGSGDIPTFEEDTRQSAIASYTPSDSRVVGEDYHTARERIVGTFERKYLYWVLQEAEGNLSEAARVAGVDRTTLYRLMEKHELEKEHILTDSNEADDPDATAAEAAEA